MTGLLIKKQLMEIFSSLFTDRKTGKRRKTGGIILYVLLYIFVFMSVAVVFIATAAGLSQVLLSSEFMEMTGHGPWLYFAIMGLTAILVGSIGSVFTTYASLYMARDNELLLSLPIPASKILASRILTVYLLSLLYCSFVWLPSVVIYWIMKGASFGPAAMQLLIGLFIALLVTVISAVLGWLVALIAARIRNRSAVVVALSMIFFVGYYYVCLNMQQIMESVMLNADKIGTAIKAKIYPIYVLGRGAAGETGAFISFLLIASIAFAACCIVLSRSFVKIVTMKKGEKKAKFTMNQIRSSGMQQALFKKELKYFVSNPTYMLNCGLGILIIPIGCVLAVIKADYIRSLILVLSMMMDGVDKLIPLLIIGAAGTVTGMNGIASPSVSLEGKTYWILRSLPVDSRDVLKAKEKLHVVLNAPACILAAVVLGIVMNVNVPMIVLSVMLSVIFTVFSADLALAIGLIRANINWTNPTVPIKQDIGVLIYMLLSMVFAVAIPGVYFLIGMALEAWLYALIAASVYALLTVLLRKWIFTKGKIRYEEL